MNTPTLVCYDDVVHLMMDEDEGQWLWALRKPTRRGGAWPLQRSLPNGRQRTVLLAPMLGTALGSRWGHDRKRRLHGKRDGYDVLRLLRMTPAGMQWPMNHVETVDGVAYTVVDRQQGLYGRGVVRAIATGDAGLIRAGYCGGCGAGTTPALDLVTERKLAVCTSCRGEVPL